ncbi:MAG: NFACT RNA binding domain-containing protein [Syntrophomonadaceae bacterium]|nr:NFACT RNA binding domain-containing protein [Syntrophomonadaceae bacterium]MDD3888292.1 NFACT RNA binding domain-containing protein [Syntrophomonadaceae bacterium]
MPFDGITIKALTKELNTTLSDGRIEKIHQPEKDELVIAIRQRQAGTLRLLISANARWARMHINTDKRPNPTSPPSFCMLLRKYLEGGKIKEIKQVDFERIVHIRIEALDDFREWKDKLLICEFMGRHSNIILVNPETNIIIDAIKKYGSDLSSYREVLPGKEYIDPPAQGKFNPEKANFETFVQLMWQQPEGTNTSSAVFNVYSGISPFSAKEICSSGGINPAMRIDQCGEYELNVIYQRLKKLLDDISNGNSEPVVLYSGNQPKEFAPYNFTLPLTRAEHFSSMNETCDCYYKDKLNLIRLESLKINLTRNIKNSLDKANKKLFFQEGDFKAAQENEKYKLWGELLTAYAHQFKKGDINITLDNYYSNDTISLTLNPRYTPIENAQKFYKTYNKSRSAIKHLDKFIAANRNEIEYLESVLVAVDQCENPSQIEDIVEELEKVGYLKHRARRAKVNKEKSEPRRFISSDGLEILAGRNNRQNDFLTFKIANKNDLWLHSKDIPGTHVIIKFPVAIKSINDIPDATLEEAATIAAYFSKAKNSKKVPVDYTFRLNVNKPRGAKPGMVTYVKYWTIVAEPQSQKLLDLLNAEQNI